MDPQTNIYLQYYKAQSGGQLPAFHGARRGQYGAGLGDILRGLFRTVFPIAMRGASSFLSETLRAKDNGAGWGAAAKSALAPAGETLLTNAVDAFNKKQNTENTEQTGNGTRRRRRRRRTLQQTGCGRGGKSYKRRAKRKASKSRHPAKRIKFLNF